MVYGMLKKKIKTFVELVKQTKLDMLETVEEELPNFKEFPKEASKKLPWVFCKCVDHRESGKFLPAKISVKLSGSTRVLHNTSAFSCYGCGNIGCVRSNFFSCKVVDVLVSSMVIDFCTVNVSSGLYPQTISTLKGI